MQICSNMNLFGKNYNLSFGYENKVFLFYFYFIFPRGQNNVQGKLIYNTTKRRKHFVVEFSFPKLNHNG
jgi:hypothetical protein